MTSSPRTSRHIAIDLGAESGRVILGTIHGGRVAIDVIHRFPSTNGMIDGHFRWDLPGIFAQIGEGLALVGKRGIAVDSIGVDTWGVDYGLVDEAGSLVEGACCYRDARTTGMPDQVAAIAGGDQALFARTGVASMIFNTVYQLAAHRRDRPANLDRAARMLFIPDLLHTWLGGEPVNEWSIAGTSGLTRAGKPEWDDGLLQMLGLPRHLFNRIVKPGTRTGTLRPELAARFGFAQAPAIVVPPSHDTAAAAGASPGDPDTTVYLSSGTWSLVGCVADQPLLTAEARSSGYGNEISADGRSRVNRNIMGLWLLQETRRTFEAAGKNYSYQQMADMAAAAKPSTAALDVNDQRFFAATGSGAPPMPERIANWCREKAIAVPADDAALIRFILDGLATTYGHAVQDLARLTGRRFTAVHIIGGGSQNRLLNQLTADACGLPVVAGPVEATALGNILVQAIGLGLTPAEARALVRASADISECRPSRPQPSFHASP